MKKIIPFKKEIIFNSNISEITSISLEHKLSIDNLNVFGEFIVSGDYKISDNSDTVEPFDYNIPFNYVLDELIDTKSATVDVDDFYYEIVNEKVLSVSIDVCVDKLKEVLIVPEITNIEEKKDIIEELFEEQNRNNNISNDDNNIIINEENNNIVEQESNALRCVEEEDVLPGNEKINKVVEKNNEIITAKEKKENINDKINSIFSNVGDGDLYISYNVYIIREGDTVDSIMEKYSITEEDLKKYNNLSDLKLGDKIIIPAK